MGSTSTLTIEQAASFADIALANVNREFPHKLDHVMANAADVRAPRTLHPAFYGSFDWHSCVHMHWLLVRVLRLHPALPKRSAVVATCDRHFTPSNIAQECAYLARPESRSFERTYGWAWLLALALELRRTDQRDMDRWSLALQPLARDFAARYVEYLPLQQDPIRYGTHANSAFGLLFAIRYARVNGEPTLEAACLAAALRWFADDRDAPAAWEPSGADFLSPVLIEATLMCEVLAPLEFAEWLGDFLPGLADRNPARLFTPAPVSDRSDPYIVHLDGLNLSRAWCFSEIARSLPEGDPRGDILDDAAAIHRETGLVGLASGDYVGRHWLATFATLALTSRL